MPPERPLAMKCLCAHEKEVVVSAAGVDDLPTHMNHSKALGREMLESAGLERTAAATVACRLQHLEREEREQDDRWPGEHGGREQKPG